MSIDTIKSMIHEASFASLRQDADLMFMSYLFQNKIQSTPLMILKYGRLDGNRKKGSLSITNVRLTSTMPTEFDVWKRTKFNCSRSTGKHYE